MPGGVLPPPVQLVVLPGLLLQRPFVLPQMLQVLLQRLLVVVSFVGVCLCVPWISGFIYLYQR